MTSMTITQMTSTTGSFRWAGVRGGLLLALLVVSAWAMLFPVTVVALPPWNEVRPPEKHCHLGLKPYVGLIADQGILLRTDPNAYSVLARSSIRISAENAKITVTPSDCSPYFVPLDSFEWQITNSPPGNPFLLTDRGTLTPRFTPTLSGPYTVRFIACPRGCVIDVEGDFLTVPATTIDLVLTALDQLVVPPKTNPRGFSLSDYSGQEPPTFFPDAKNRWCNGGPPILNSEPPFLHGGSAAVLDPQWVTVINPWQNQFDYETLQGVVSNSHISRIDNFINHYHQDQKFDVSPDPKYRRLLSAELRNDIFTVEVEWEHNEIPESFWPSPGDRVSVFGYWVLDCGHDFHTEIHPPVGIAVHRYGAINIPGSEPIPELGGHAVGRNVYVPGVVTDIWFNDRGGKITEYCDNTTLHQPGRGSDSDACVPTTFENPLQREIHLRYLPSCRSPAPGNRDPATTALRPY